MARPWTPGLAGELAAIAVLLLVGVRSARIWLNYRDQAANTKKDMVGVLAQPGIVLGSLTGVGLRGYLIDPAANARTQVVIFLLRPKSALRELALWDRVAADLGGNPEFQFRGFCEDAACRVLAAVPRGVVVMQAGGARTLEGLMQADRRGDALLIGATLGRVLADIPWRNGVNPRQVSDEIAANQGPQ